MRTHKLSLYCSKCEAVIHQFKYAPVEKTICQFCGNKIILSDYLYNQFKNKFKQNEKFTSKQTHF
jgi:hypothetical protein